MDPDALPYYRTIATHEFAEVRERLSNSQLSLFSLRAFRRGELVSPFSAGTLRSRPTYLTIQLAAAKHVTMVPEFLQYINHGCDPNVFFDTDSFKVIALRDIAPGEELLFFYPSAEWKMAQPFICHCGYRHCLGEIRGAAYLPSEVLKQYKLTGFIQRELARRPRKKLRA